MRTRWILGMLIAAAAAAPAAQAQGTGDPNIPTETQDRLQRGVSDLNWLDLIGLLGLFGLVGLRKEHADDSYHPTSLE
jgi:hypothetical protein